METKKKLRYTMINLKSKREKKFYKIIDILMFRSTYRRNDLNLRRVSVERLHDIIDKATPSMEKIESLINDVCEPRAVPKNLDGLPAASLLNGLVALGQRDSTTSEEVFLCAARQSKGHVRLLFLAACKAVRDAKLVALNPIGSTETLSLKGAGLAIADTSPPMLNQLDALRNQPYWTVSIKDIRNQRFADYTYLSEFENYAPHMRKVAHYIKWISSNMAIEVAKDLVETQDLIPAYQMFIFDETLKPAWLISKIQENLKRKICNRIILIGGSNGLNKAINEIAGDSHDGRIDTYWFRRQSRKKDSICLKPHRHPTLQTAQKTVSKLKNITNQHIKEFHKFKCESKKLMIVAASLGNAYQEKATYETCKLLSEKYSILLILTGNPRKTSIDKKLSLHNTENRKNKIYQIKMQPLVNIFSQFSSGLDTSQLGKKLKGTYDTSKYNIGEKYIYEYIDHYLPQSDGFISTMILFREFFKDLTENQHFEFLINFDGRNPYSCIVTAACKSLGITTADVLMVPMADSPRQLPLSGDIVGVVDTTQAKHASTFWSKPISDFLPIGYLWRQTAFPSSPSQHASKPPGKPQVVLVATQAGVTDGNLEMIDRLGAALNGQPNVHVILRPHPREADGTFERYRDALKSQHGICHDRILQGPDDLEATLCETDIVLTQFSNVGLQGAMAGKPVIQYLAASGHISRAAITAPYALNIFEQPQAAEAIQRVLTSAAERSRIAAMQVSYFRDNPALLRGDGLDRLVEKLQELAIQRRQ